MRRVPWTGSPVTDYVEAEAFEQLLDEAGVRAAEFSGRMKVGDVLHDPPEGLMPALVLLARRVPGGQSVSAVALHPPAARRRRGARRGRRRRRRRHGQDDARDRSACARRSSSGPTERVLVVTYTEVGPARGARPAPGAGAARWLRRPAAAGRHDPCARGAAAPAECIWKPGCPRSCGGPDEAEVCRALRGRLRRCDRL